MFENITAAPADPILGLADLFRTDERPGKINLGIGVYKDETGKTPVLTSVKKAEQYLLENETTKNYLGIDGIPEFGRCTQELLFGKGSALINDKRARTAQTPGGTGALRVAADFLAKNTSVKRVWVSNPSWPNHKSVFNSAGLEVREYAYYDAENHTLDFDAGWVMAAAMEQHYVASLSFVQAVNQCIEVKGVIFRIIISVLTNFQTGRVKDA
ncbi:aminotransferase class I/II-fold pyridoxal phosphate-dependent enzyme, partial [Escherichia coli]|uniref:aminotransferase class I/II-fold pyridoxal phosphate-dependent enzyme n=1 Tax=Escherichia coli TaxID=562 RepID=UPI000ADFD26F